MKRKTEDKKQISQTFFPTFFPKLDISEVQKQQIVNRDET
jgi:hypothetical protein